MICGSRFYRRLYKPILLRINKFTWNKLYLEGSGNISALEALNASKPIILNDILHFLGPIGFEKIMSVSNKLINLLLGGSVVSYLVLNSWTLFLVVVLNRRADSRYSLLILSIICWSRVPVFITILYSYLEYLRVPGTAFKYNIN